MTVHPTPVPQLGNDRDLCWGESIQLSPGPFSQYVWQNGSTGPTFIINSTGQYYVKVTDNNGCVASDTVRINNVFPLPSAFLPRDTALCSYSQFTLRTSIDYTSYLWSNGSRGATIIVDHPGIYWLEVTDAHPCMGRDSITINPKQCMSGVYIPTAFTPNRDGKNDLFRVMAFGVVKKFELAVYNRWGQVIFHTTDANKGWDGKVSGIEQGTGIYVWTCRYQLEGSEEIYEKGTVTAIR